MLAASGLCMKVAGDCARWHLGLESSFTSVARSSGSKKPTMEDFVLKFRPSFLIELGKVFSSRFWMHFLDLLHLTVQESTSTSEITPEEISQLAFFGIFLRN